MILSLRTRRYIADVWLAGYTRDQFRQRVNEMPIPTIAKGAAMRFWLDLEYKMHFANSKIKEK